MHMGYSTVHASDSLAISVRKTQASGNLHFLTESTPVRPHTPSARPIPVMRQDSGTAGTCGTDSRDAMKRH